MLRRLLNLESKTITAGAVILVLSGLLSRLLGLLRDRIFAGMFGAGDVLDTYYAAFRIPDFLFSVLIVGALSASFVPVFVSIRKQSLEDGWRLVNNVLGIALIALIAVAALFIVIAPSLLDIVAPGFEGMIRDRAILLTRIMMLSPLLLGISGVISSVLQSLHRFMAYALAPLFYNIGIILGALFFVPVFGVSGLAWGVILGAFLHLAIQLPALRGTSFSFRPFISPLTVGAREIFRLMVPRTIGVGAYQINLIVVTAIASLLGAGSITIFNFSNNLHHVPIGAIGIPFAIAAFPRLSEAFFDNAHDRFRSLLTSTFRSVFYWVVPISAFVIVLRAQIVRVVLGTGEFSWEATRLTAAALALFSVSMIAQAVIPLLARAFYARHNTKIPVIVGVISMVINVTFAFLFVRWLGNGMGSAARSLLSLEGIENVAVLGLPIAFSIAGFVNALVLALLLRGDHLWDVKSSLVSFWQIIVATIAASFIVWLLLRVLAPITGTTTFVGVFLQGVGAGVGGLIVYWVVTRAFRMPEASFQRLWRLLRSPDS